MSRLKPCPFCGGNDIGGMQVRFPLPDFEEDGGDWVLGCRACNTSITFFNKRNKDEVIEAWNRRAKCTEEDT
ncbi:MAG: Lar family restriction alleviation protein [Oscillospiraceae bacterium]|nr:Lar family restriction alleviation protein [Oscillospiraceae bacterium]